MIANIFFQTHRRIKIEEASWKVRQTDGKWEEKKYENERVNPGSPTPTIKSSRITKLRDGEEDVAKEIT